MILYRVTQEAGKIGYVREVKNKIKKILDFSN